jgi:hypothetical protein
MKYVHVFDGTEHEAPEGSLNWPWMPETAAAAEEDHQRAREAARAVVRDTLETAAKRGPGRPRKTAEAPDDA